MREQATRNRPELLPGTGGVEICTELMGEAPRAGYALTMRRGRLSLFESFRHSSDLRDFERPVESPECVVGTDASVEPLCRLRRPVSHRPRDGLDGHAAVPELGLERHVGTWRTPE